MHIIIVPDMRTSDIMKPMSRARGIRRFEGSVSAACAIVLIVIQVLGSFTIGASGENLNCSSVKHVFESRKINITDVPKQPLSGSLCPGVSCCSSHTEALLRLQLRRQHEQSVKQQLSTLASVLSTRSVKFDEFFKELLATAKGGFHDMFKRTYGIIYEQNSFVFTDLFEELEQYYTKGHVDLTDTMENFFSKLYQKMFTVINAHYKFDDKYLQCVSDHMKELKPFGDVPHKLSVEIKRSFVATRTFSQALSVASEIANNMLNMPVSEDCGRALLKMGGCPVCRGVTAPTCYPYCTNVAKGCLAHHAELNTDWNNFVDAIEKVTDRLIGPFNIQMVVGPIDTKISDAVMNFQENSYQVSNRVFIGCGGKPSLGERTRRAVLPRFRRAAQSRPRERAGLDLERLVRDIRTHVKETRQWWAGLPYQTCNVDANTSARPTDNCWNGTAVASYLPAVMDDGLNNQQNNPEVSVDTVRPNSLLNEQIFALKTIVSKLKNAYNGLDVEWIDNEDIASGSGSGDAGIVETDDSDDEDSGSGGGLPTERPPPPPPPPTTTRNNEDNQLHPLEHETGRTRYNVSGSAGQMAQRPSLTRALATYLLPLVVVWVGSSVTEWLQ